MDTLEKFLKALFYLQIFKNSNSPLGANLSNSSSLRIMKIKMHFF